MRLSDQYQRNAFTRHLTPEKVLHVPVAHGEGRFVMSAALLQEISVQGLNVFQYCDQAGRIIEHFPINPNGSMANIAAISNKAGNVMAMMPHPERTTNGDAIFLSMRDYINDTHAQTNAQQMRPLDYYPRPAHTPAYQKPAAAHEWLIDLMITDNHALTVQNTLRHLGFDVTVKRQTHWEIQCQDAAALQVIEQSGVLFNERKEMQTATPGARNDGPQFLVRPKEDLLGAQKLQTLQDHFSITAVQAIRHGVLWQFSGEKAKMAELVKQILSTNIIYNPYAHDCYQYNT